MSEADERVCIYAVILTDTWDLLRQGNSDTEMKPYTQSYMILKATDWEQITGVMLPIACNKPGGSILHLYQTLVNVWRAVRSAGSSECLFPHPVTKNRNQSESAYLSDAILMTPKWCAGGLSWSSVCRGG